MKTAMQEAIELVKKYDSRKIPFKVLLFNLEQLLKKEKEQIINARDSTASELMKNMEDVWILGKSEYKTRTPEEYYNQTYWEKSV
jgi:hypothetical protein